MKTSKKELKISISPGDPKYVVVLFNGTTNSRWVSGVALLGGGLVQLIKQLLRDIIQHQYLKLK